MLIQSSTTTTANPTRLNLRQLVLLGLLLVVVEKTIAVQNDGEKVVGEKGEGEGKWYHKIISDSGVQMGQIDLDDLPLKGLSADQALGLMFQRYRARMMHQQEPHHFGTEDLSEREIAEICGNSASLECGKKVLKNIPLVSNSGDGSQEQSLSIHHRCTLRKDFLDCIDVQRKSCRRQSEKGVYPRLPPKSIIRSTQSRIWRALWTSGGCTLIN